jgi:pimeloyl-ACP methyl ester carboxylesterase
MTVVGKEIPAAFQIKRFSKKFAKMLLLCTAVLLVGFMVYCVINQSIGAQADQRAFPPPGQLYDIGEYRLHLYCTGPQGTGNPTVILEAMSGGLSAEWGWIQPEVAKETRVCSYDRAGRGWSNPNPHPITLEYTVSDLHRLLQKAAVSGPYILVGHSIGGIYVRQYAADYPNEVVGMVLVDSSHPDQLARVPEFQTGYKRESRIDALLPVLARLGFLRVFISMAGKTDFSDLPSRQYTELAAFWSSPENLDSVHAEVLAEPAIFADAHPLGNLGSLPLAVISRGYQVPAYWIELQNELAALSSNSLHITVPGATHTALAFNPEYAKISSQAILQVVAAARTGQKLASR